MNLVFDFDGTITVKDTIGHLAQAAIAFHKERHGRDLQAAWDQAVQSYLSDYQSYKDSYRPREEERRCVAEELRFLAGLKGVEDASLDRVGESGVFSGLEREDLFRMGVDGVRSGAVSARDGFARVLEVAGQRGWTVGVISVNWSRAFIRGVLHPHDDSNSSSSSNSSNISVITNEICEGGEIKGPEFLGGGRLTTSADKANCLEHHVAGGQSGSTTTTTTTLYFGDSTTDMECLLHQRGVVISAEDDDTPSSPLLKTLHRVGVRVPHVGSSHDEPGHRVYWARDFHEVLQSGILEQMSRR